VTADPFPHTLNQKQHPLAVIRALLMLIAGLCVRRSATAVISTGDFFSRVKAVKPGGQGVTLAIEQVEPQVRRGSRHYAGTAP
jgi:hypothetical protein